MLFAEAEAEHIPLPLRRLAEEAELASFERAALVGVAAAELSTAHERLYAYLLDDLARAHASAELLLLLTSGDPAPASVRRRAFGPAGALRRLGLVVADGTGPEARTPLRLAPGLLDWLIGAQPGCPLRLRDPDLIHPAPGQLPPGLEAALARDLLRRGAGVVGVWGGIGTAVADTVEALAAAAGRNLRRLRLVPPAAAQAEPAPALGLERELLLAAGCDAIAWVELDRLGWTAGELPAFAASLAAALCGRAGLAIVISGRDPWRPTELLEAGVPYAELLPSPDTTEGAAALIAAAIPGLGPVGARDLAGRHRFEPRQRRTLAALAAARGGDAAAVEAACRMIATAAPTGFAVAVEPRRGPDDLVLPPRLHAQVMEVAGFFLHAAEVDRRWGFGRMGAAPGALKVLFTGDPGTGKTLAAEVIAYRLGRQLVKVDLAQVVSKWVGETEKNLDALFGQAERSAAVLFFDEADTLCGKRGEVRHGTDRYANLEVGYLLQRFEAYRGLVILASNLRDELDPAFTRRFHLQLNFPRPGEEERRRLWELAFAPEDGAPPPDLDWSELVRLDLTGAGIHGAARLAALLAAVRGDERIGMEHLAEAVGRQLRQEARLLRGPPVRALAIGLQEAGQ
ncbi:MAG: ATP-binding protein [Hyphomicrobiaceae bacterium]